MKWLNGYRIRLVLVGFMAAIVLGGGSSKADFTFGEPTNLGPVVNSSAREVKPAISSDGLSLYFESNRPGGYGDVDLWATTRETTDHPWSPPFNLGPTVNSSAMDGQPSIYADGLTLLFVSQRPGGSGNKDIWMTTRIVKENPWTEPVNLGATINTPFVEANPCISPNGLSLYFSSNRPGGYGSSGSDLYVTSRATVNEPWSEPVNLGSTVNSTTSDIAPNISADGLWLFFSSRRPGGYGGAWDIWLTRRATTDDAWTEPVNLGSTVNSSAHETGASISVDGQTLYFYSYPPGGNRDIWQAPIIPIVDLNGDEIVDVKDVVIMTEHWGENYSLCDIGPTPLGDGIVDVQDLIVLTEYMEPIDRTLIAHWALDEEEGTIAYDSAGINDAFVIGDPVWQPTGGIVNGALQLDGVDDVAIAGSVLNPAGGPFSVLAWIRGGTAGQAVISESGGTNWLSTDLFEGSLMTELTNAGQSGDPLLSNTVITDGKWHSIGLVWDGSYIMLYVDNLAVAEDTKDGLEGSGNGLYIGAGKNMQPGTFFSGLIDDVRIYNRAVIP